MRTTISPRREYHQKYHALYPNGKHPVSLKCLECGEVFEIAPRRVGRAKYCSQSCRLTAHNGRGEEAPAWKGGRSKERELWQGSLAHKNWRKAVLERDGYACVLCGASNEWLHADHIKPWAFFPELRTDVENGRTLCVPCHKATDTYGVKARKLYQVLTVI